MANDVTAMYRLRFKDLASKGILRVAGAARGMARGLTVASAGAGAAGAAMLVSTTMVNRALAEQIQLSKSVGVSHKDFSTLAGVARNLGFEFDHIVDLQEELNNKVGEFKFLGELTSFEEGLQGLGLEASKFIKLDPAKQMEALLVASAGLDQQVASSSADMLLGGEASKIFGKFNAEIKESGLSVEAYFNKQRELNMLTDKGRVGAVAYTRSLKSLQFFTTSLAQEAFGQLGGVLTPVIDKLVDFVRLNQAGISAKITQYASQLSGALKEIDFAKIAKGIQSFATSSNELFGKLGGLVQGLGGAGKAMKTLLGLFVGGQVLGFIASMAPLIAILGGPVTLAIAGTIALGVLLWRNWDTVKIKAMVLGESLRQAWVSIYVKIAEVGAKIKARVDIVKGVFSTLVAAGVVLKGKLGGLWDGIKSIIAAGVNFYIDRINNLLALYNKVAGSGMGKKLGMAEVKLIKEVSVSKAADAQLKAQGAMRAVPPFSQDSPQGLGVLAPQYLTPQAVTAPARDAVASRREMQPQKVVVDLRGEIKGADVKAQVSGDNGKRSQGGYNMPLGRMSPA